MDAFYASVEQLDNPELKGKCVIVGGDSNRGVVSAASYEAREFGVHSAMPIFQAKQKCPQGTYLFPRMNRYKQVSRRVMTVLREFTPLVEPISIDEAYMDISGCGRLHGSPQEIGMGVKSRVHAAVGLTCTVGIAPNKFLSKIASDLDKPDGLTLIEPHQVAGFIKALPIRKVPGVGKAGERSLMRLGIKTLGDINRFPGKTLTARLGKFGARLIALSKGIDTSTVTPHSAHKSVSTERTLSEDTRDFQLLQRYLLRHADSVARQLRKLNVRACTVSLKIKYADFKQITRQVSLPTPIQSANALYAAGRQLLESNPLKKKVRLIGLGASGLTLHRRPQQMDIFDVPSTMDPNWEKVEHALDGIAQKYGRHVIRRGTLKD